MNTVTPIELATLAMHIAQVEHPSVVIDAVLFDYVASAVKLLEQSSEAIKVWRRSHSTNDYTA